MLPAGYNIIDIFLNRNVQFLLLFLARALFNDSLFEGSVSGSFGISKQNRSKQAFKANYNKLTPNTA